MTVLTFDVNMLATEFAYLEAAVAELVSWEAGEIKNKDLAPDRRKELRKLRRYLDGRKFGEFMRKHNTFGYDLGQYGGYTMSLNIKDGGANAGKGPAEKALAKFREFCPSTFIWQAWRPGAHVGTTVNPIELDEKVTVGLNKSLKKRVAVDAPRTRMVHHGDAVWEPPLQPHPGYLTKPHDRPVKDEDGDEVDTENVTRPTGSLRWRGGLIAPAPPRA